MKTVRIAVAAMLAMAAGLPAAQAQTRDELQRLLTEKQEEVARLRARLAAMDAAAAPSAGMPATGMPATGTPAAGSTAAASGGSVGGDPEGGRRALERALVREHGLLLAPGTHEAEVNAVYSYGESGDGSARRHAFGPGLVLRSGLPWRTQLEVAVPYVYERRRQGDESWHAHGIGDVALGLSHQFLNEHGARPALIGNLSYQAASGDNTVFDNTARPVALGSGFRSLQASLTAVKRVDPLVFFGSYAYTHMFDDRKNGVTVDPGDSHQLRFGTALAASPSTSLRAQMTIQSFQRLRIGGTAVPGSDDPFGLLELGGSVLLSGSALLDVLIGAGLTRNAPDFRVTVAVPIRF